MKSSFPVVIKRLNRRVAVCDIYTGFYDAIMRDVKIHLVGKASVSPDKVPMTIVSRRLGRLYGKVDDTIENTRSVVTNVEVYDGDTIYCDFNVADILYKERLTVMLTGIDAPELRGSERQAGLEARNELQKAIENSECTMIEITDKVDKYGRLPGILWCYYRGNPVNMNQWMVEHKYAI